MTDIKQEKPVVGASNAQNPGAVSIKPGMPRDDLKRKIAAESATGISSEQLNYGQLPFDVAVKSFIAGISAVRDPYYGQVMRLVVDAHGELPLKEIHSRVCSILEILTTDNNNGKTKPAPKVAEFDSASGTLTWPAETPVTLSPNGYGQWEVAVPETSTQRKDAILSVVQRWIEEQN